jgi:tRNA(Glu) U13 pseudouridine synthase TruD
MQQEGITYRDFIIKSLPEISPEGSSRKLYSEIKKLKIGTLENDELNKGMKKVKISFFLNKGDYATMAIKNMFREAL